MQANQLVIKLYINRISKRIGYVIALWRDWTRGRFWHATRSTVTVDQILLLNQTNPGRNIIQLKWQNELHHKMVLCTESETSQIHQMQLNLFIQIN